MVPDVDIARIVDMSWPIKQASTPKAPKDERVIKTSSVRLNSALTSASYTYRAGCADFSLSTI